MDDGASELESGHLGREAENVEEGQKGQSVEVIVFPPRQILHPGVLEV